MGQYDSGILKTSEIAGVSAWGTADVTGVMCRTPLFGSAEIETPCKSQGWQSNNDYSMAVSCSFMYYRKQGS